MTRFHRSTPIIIATALILACQSHANPARPTIQTTLTVPASQPAGSDFDRTQYRPSSMEGIFANVNSIWNTDLLEQDPNNSIYLEIDSELTFPSRVALTYLGEFREIPPHRMAAISAWLRGPPALHDQR